MRAVKRLTAAALLLLLTLMATPAVGGSLLLWLEGTGSLLSERLPDPSRVLEHVPFTFDRDLDVAAVAPARVDWKETDTHHHILIDVPGLTKEELKIEVEENRILRVSGERQREEEKKNEKWHRLERSYGKFWRQFRLPDNADLDSMSAELRDGVLTVTLRKLATENIKGPRVVGIAGGDGDGKRRAKMDL